MNLYILDGAVYSIAADAEIDVYEFHFPSEDVDEFSDVLRYRSGGKFDRRDVDEARRLADSGNLRRDRKPAAG